MSDSITAGAYVIRNKNQTSMVLHIEQSSKFKVLAYEQDEGRYSNQQIWWVEPLPNYEDNEPEKGPVYSITNPATGKSLDVNPRHDPNESSNICNADQHGEPWQRWRLHKIDDDKGRPYYTIASVFSDHVIDIHNGKPIEPGPGYELHSQGYAPGYDQHCWEFVIPIVGFPPGWFQMQNSGTRDLLSQIYFHNPPILLPSPESPRPCQYREGWEFQWTLRHTEFHKSKSPRNSWYIINRLTRKRLSSFSGNPVCKTLVEYDRGLKWKLELDPSCNWKIINLENSGLLEQSTIIRGGGTAMVCVDQKFTKGGSKSWILAPPVLHTTDYAPQSPPEPPQYEVTASTSTG